MKNIRLIAFFFNTIICTLLVWGGKSILYAQEKALPFHIDFGSDLKINENNSKDKLINSIKLELPFLEANWSGEVYSKTNSEQLKNNFGFLIQTQKLFPVVPLVFMNGNLNLSGSISRLNSPQLSQTFGWATGAVKASSLNVSLPQPGVFSKPQSYFAQVGFGDNKGFFKFMDFNVFWNEQSLTCSTDIKLRFFKTIDTGFCFTGGIYPYNQVEENTWFSKNAFYHEGKHFCSSMQICFSAKSFGALFIFNNYESPFGHIDFTYRGETYFKFKRFSFNVSAFYNPNERLLTSSKKVLDPLLQIRGNSQYQFITGTKRPVIVKSGISAQADLKLNEQEHSIKTNSGFQITGQNTSLNGSAKINLKLKTIEDAMILDFTGGSLQTNAAICIKGIKPELSVKFSFTPDEKKQNWTYSEKIGFNLCCSDELEIKGGGSISFEQKNGKTKTNYSAAVSIRFNLRYLTADFRFDYIP